MISVRDLTKAYGNVLAVDRISLEVPRGQIVGFLGPNGGGKSTTIRILTCYMPPTSGGATVNGYDIFHQSERAQSLGYLPENASVPGNEGPRVPRLPRPLAEDGPAGPAQRIDYVVERCWLDPVRDRIIGHLSKGYRQRVGLADALLHDPPVLILDEPTVGLDPSQIRETRNLIKASAATTR